MQYSRLENSSQLQLSQNYTTHWRTICRSGNWSPTTFPNTTMTNAVRHELSISFLRLIWKRGRGSRLRKRLLCWLCADGVCLHRYLVSNRAISISSTASRQNGRHHARLHSQLRTVGGMWVVCNSTWALCTLERAYFATHHAHSVRVRFCAFIPPPYASSLSDLMPENYLISFERRTRIKKKKRMNTYIAPTNSESRFSSKWNVR